MTEVLTMNDTLDRWIQRVTLAALLALTAALLTVGALLYAAPSKAGPPDSGARTQDILTGTRR
ncbi:hypothetical protein BON30_18120 [Cystobacter ferrugineus]|uniref:Uncharacterized protein n=2 Tax=Cystobacter ferrugineus TaxID=83449 RepID=A0A1L9BAX9_9BACT|nr:hypothetical protein BON30_18120 [Cystobacter ferrugineus]